MFLGAVRVSILGGVVCAMAVSPRFEVASIKPCKAGASGGRRSGSASLSPGRLHLGCSGTTVKGLIHSAYVLFANGHVNPPWNGDVPISGGPAWIDTESYQIDAKADGTQTQGMMHGPMLQALLEDRFKLRVHRQAVEVPVYELTVAKAGIKMQPWEPGSCTPIDFAFLTQFPPQPLPALPPGQEYCGGVGPDGTRWLATSETRKGENVVLECRGINLDDLCKMVLGNRLDRPVVNATGIDRRFGFRLEFTPDESTPKFLEGDSGLPDDLPRGPSIFTALQEQLGLKLSPAKGQGESLVIDHVERPSRN
jgi:uncharacterized protein (TIGR03435 family)